MIDYSSIESLDNISDVDKKDPLFMLNYFSRRQRDKKDYKHLTPELLRNKHFVFSVSIQNPDIYLMSDDSLRNMDSFKWLKSALNKSEYVKYAPKEFFENRTSVLRAISDNVMNFHEMPEVIRKDSEVVKHLIEKMIESHQYLKQSDFKKLFKSLDSDYLMNRNNALHILEKTNFEAMGAMPYIYKEDKSLFKACFLRNTENLKYFSYKLLDDYELCLSMVKGTSINFKHDKFDVSKFLVLIKNEYLTEEMCEFTKRHIGSTYKNFNQDKRANKSVLKHIFDGENIDLMGTFLRMIPIDELRNELLKFAKTKSRNCYREKDEYQETIEARGQLQNLLNKYFLKEDLFAQLSTVDTDRVKKIKI